MANRPNKSLAEYIHQGDLIIIADDSAIAAGELWAFVPASRTKHDALLATLKAKATTADTVGPAYDLKVEEKDAFDLDAEKATSILAVYIENAFPDNAEQITTPSSSTRFTPPTTRRRNSILPRCRPQSQCRIMLPIPFRLHTPTRSTPRQRASSRHSPR